jgi:cell division initiation protein
MFTPQELKRPAFNKTLKGYVPSEVDEYVFFLLTKYKEVYEGYAALEAKYKEAVDRLDAAKNEENTITQTIVNAQKMADAIIADAKSKSKEITDSVSAGCERVLEAYRRKVAEERDKLAECEELVLRFKDSLYEAYKAHIEMIDKIMPDADPTPYLSDEELVDTAIDFAKESLDPETLGEIMGADDESDAADDSDESDDGSDEE